MKIAVITWHNYPNFGSALQAYALHTFINRNGGDATIINYVPGEKEKFRLLRLLMSYLDCILPYAISARLHYRFLAFANKEFRLTKLYTNEKQLKELNDEFQMFICGSDQIWAPNVLNKVYLLNFVNDENIKISYAASIGLPVIPNEKKAVYKQLLSRFLSISVREEQGAELLKNEFGINSKVVLDPTLLLTCSDWKKIMRENRLCKKYSGKYILCYFLGQSEFHRRIVEELSMSLGLKVIILSRFSMDFRKNFIKEEDAGPCEFLSYIYNAAMVVTDSFHGLCFSINMNKDFYVLKRFSETDPVNQNSRIINILKKLGLLDRLIDNMPQTIRPIDYSIPNQRLRELRNYSINYLIENRIINK